MPGINVYPKGSQNPSRTIGVGFPQYIAATADGTLYVPNQTVVEIVPPGMSSPTATIANSLVLPEGVAVH